MKRIKYFNSFNESLILQIINETVLYFLPEIKSKLELLSKDGNEIAKKLLQKVGVDTEKDITLVDLEGDKLSFMSKAAIGSYNPEFLNKLEMGREILETI